MAKRRLYSGKHEDARRPPENEPWTWQTQEMIASPAWRERSISLVRLIDFLLSENMAHAGTENGNLGATYDQLEAAGVTRRLISRTIAEAVARGLVQVVSRGGRKGILGERALSRYRLTWVAAPQTYGTSRFNTVWDPPTNEWKAVTSEIVEQRMAAWDREQEAAQNWRAKAKAEKQDAGATKSTEQVSQSPLSQVPQSPLPNQKTPIYQGSAGVDEVALPSISRGGRGAGVGPARSGAASPPRKRQRRAGPSSGAATPRSASSSLGEAAPDSVGPSPAVPRPATPSATPREPEPEMPSEKIGSDNVLQMPPRSTAKRRQTKAAANSIDAHARWIAEVDKSDYDAVFHALVDARRRLVSEGYANDEAMSMVKDVAEDARTDMLSWGNSALAYVLNTIDTRWRKAS